MSNVMWLLFDHRGRVVRMGEEAVQHTHIERVLQQRFPGIQVADKTMTPVTDSQGKPIKDSYGRTVKYECVWLAEGSPLPNETMSV